MSTVVFWEEGFPFVDTQPLERGALEAALNEADVRFVPLADLDAALAAGPDLFVNPYGSAFPKSAWPAFTAYLQRGGNWVNLGGAPLSRPVRCVANDERRTTNDEANTLVVGRWSFVVEVPQTQYGKALRINHAFEVALPADAALRCPPLDADLETHFHLFQPARAWALQVRLTDDKDFPEEGGSAGRRDATFRALVVAEQDGRTLAAPVVCVDRLAGDFAGGRWVLACCEGPLPLPVDLVGRLCDYATRPRAQLDVRPSFACYYPGEHAALTVRAQAARLDGDCADGADVRISVRVYARDTQKEVYAHVFKARVGRAPAIVQTSPFAAPAPGLYIVRASIETKGHSKPIAFAETGFWVYDRELMATARPLTTPVENRKSKIENRDYFYRDNQPFPITGTTYMAGDVHRKFLFEPNPAVWDADFAAMSAAGVNMVRTGLWTGWKRAMLDPGAVDEGVLRAFAAFLLTARRYDIPVIFTFFAFLPEAWGGDNPYLDPKAVAAQAEFVAAFARRFASVDDILWDFINEPSFSSPERVWSTRPNYDRYERAAWAEWLAAQGVSEDEWRERWRLTPNDPLDLPALEDFEDRYIFQGTHPIRVLDYRRFAQEKFAEWAATMARVVRENGNPRQLVTVGQDEGGTRDRPNPWFYGPVLDFTSNHSWWQNDDLLWDSLITKTPDRPNLIEETGIMFVEGVDGRAWRTPEEARNLLERKMALAFAGGCAGFIQWLWNTNVYMDSDNEVGIGFLRADGSEKPELEGFRGVARFLAANAHRMVGRKPEEVAVVIPHSNMFSVRDTATAATRRAVRVLEYGLGLPCRVVAEDRAEEVGDAKLIVLPAPRVLTEACWRTLLAKVEAGAMLLVTGYVEADEYWRPVERLKALGLETAPRPVQRRAKYWCSGRKLHAAATFGGDKVQKLEEAACARTGSLAKSAKWKDEMLDCYALPHAEGMVYYCPVPVELADNDYEVRCAYEAAAKRAGFSVRQGSGMLFRRPVEFADSTLEIFLNETNLDLPFDEDEPLRHGLRVPAGRIALAFVDRATGEVVSRYEVE